MIKNETFINEEWFPVVDEDGNITGKAPRSICHDGKSKLLHPVVHLHLFNSKGELFLQKRSSLKDIQPGKWDTSVGGHVGLDEKTEDALARETFEEIGLSDTEPAFIIRYIWESAREKELVHSFYAVSDKQLFLNNQEIDDGKFWKSDEIIEDTGKGIFTPNFEYEFSMIVETLNSKNLFFRIE